MNDIISQIPVNFDIKLLLILLAIGALIKHLNLLENFSNKFIPVILTIVAIIYAICVFKGPMIVNIGEGIINAAIAVGIHQGGKNIFINSGFLDKIFNKDAATNAVADIVKDITTDIVKDNATEILDNMMKEEVKEIIKTEPAAESNATIEEEPKTKEAE